MNEAPIKKQIPAEVRRVLERLETVAKQHGLPIAGVVLTRDRSDGYEFVLGFPSEQVGADTLLECGRYIVRNAEAMRARTPRA